jgi:hypothetical protein
LFRRWQFGAWWCWEDSALTEKKFQKTVDEPNEVDHNLVSLLLMQQTNEAKRRKLRGAEVEAL